MQQSIESAVVYQTADSDVCGIAIDTGMNDGVVLVSGGYQYRVGSHRMFVEIARELARHGVSSFRFDRGGRGDCGHLGETIFGDEVKSSLSPAIRTFKQSCPHVRKVWLFGLCDGATLVTRGIRELNGVAGVFLVNPWLDDEEASPGQTLRMFYLKRVFYKETWRALFSSEINAVSATRSILKEVLRYFSRAGTPAGDSGCRQTMADGIGSFSGVMALGLSGRDITAAKFRAFLASDARLHGMEARDNLHVKDFPESDHTFSEEGGSTKLVSWIVSTIRSSN